MNILYLCETDPDDRSDGGRLRTHLLHEALRKVGRTFVLCNDPKMRVVPGERMRMEQTWPGPVRRFVDWVCWEANSRLLWMCPKLLPFRLALNAREAFPDVAFDCVVVRYPHLGGVAEPWRYGRLFIDFDDHPLEAYETMLAPYHRALWRGLMRRVVRWVIGRIVRRCAGVWVSNPRTVGDFPAGTRVFPLENVPGEVSSSYDRSAPRATYLLTVGLLAWEPNRCGLETFLSDIWPTVRVRHPDLGLRIAGAGLPAAIRERWERIPGVSCLGFVDDLQAQYAHALAVVVPVDSGSGTCIKAREALAHSRICLSTAFGARGFSEDELKDGAVGVLAYRTAEDFLSILDLVLDPARRTEFERRGHEYARSKLTFVSFISQVERMLMT